MFQAVLITVLVYLAACYGYGAFLLWKLYAGRRFPGNMHNENPREMGEIAPPPANTALYESPPAKAA